MAVEETRDFRDIESRLSAVAVELAISQTIMRYWRALDRLGESLRRICYANAVFNYGFYKGRVEGFYPLMMQIERATLHRSHILSNVATRLDSDRAEVGRYGAAYSTLDGETLIVFGGGI